MLSMKEYVEEKYKDDIEDWESMTVSEKLDEYLYNILNLDFSDDFFKVQTIEQCINSYKKSLDNPEFKHVKDEMLNTIEELEKYKNKRLFCKLCENKSSCLYSEYYVIFTGRYEYVDYIRV